MFDQIENCECPPVFWSVCLGLSHFSSCVSSSIFSNVQNITFGQFCKAHCIKQSAKSKLHKTNHTKHISQIIAHYARKLHKPNWTELIAKNRVKRTITHSKLHKASWSKHFVQSNLYKDHLIALHTNKLDLVAYAFAKVKIIAQFQRSSYEQKYGRGLSGRARWR